MEAALAFSAELMAAAPEAERVDQWILERVAAFEGPSSPTTRRWTVAPNAATDCSAQRASRDR